MRSLRRTEHLELKNAKRRKGLGRENLMFLFFPETARYHHIVLQLVELIMLNKDGS